MRYGYFGNGDSATRLIKSFKDLRRGDTLYNIPDEENENRMGIQISDIMGNDIKINIIKKNEVKSRNITREQLEKILW